LFQLTVARRRLPKTLSAVINRGSFNTQPPEGGWQLRHNRRGIGVSFNTQPPEGGWFIIIPHNP